MKKETWYKIGYCVLRPLGWLLYPQRNIGRENIPEGPAIICASHSNAPDPVLISFAFGLRRYMHHLSKVEARSIPIFGAFMAKIGSIFIKRGDADIAAYKSCIRVLRAGERVVVFPEGTRVHGDAVIKPKTGVIHMASAQNVPIIPVYLPRDKKFFHRFTVVIGEPYYVQITQREDYERLSQELMDRIWALRDRA